MSVQSGPVFSSLHLPQKPIPVRSILGGWWCLTRLLERSEALLALPLVPGSREGPKSSVLLSSLQLTEYEWTGEQHEPEIKFYPQGPLGANVPNGSPHSSPHSAPVLCPQVHYNRAAALWEPPVERGLSGALRISEEAAAYSNGGGSVCLKYGLREPTFLPP